MSSNYVLSKFFYSLMGTLNSCESEIVLIVKPRLLLLRIVYSRFHEPVFLFLVYYNIYDHHFKHEMYW